MGYRELLEALADEVGCQVRERAAEAAQERQQLLEAARREVASRRQKVLDDERRRLDEDFARTVSRARLEQERAILGVMSREMEALRQAAEARLPALNDAELLARLVDELVPELAEGPVELRVKEGHEAQLQDHLSRNHPRLRERVTVKGTARVQGGVEASLRGCLLDNTLRSRLENAWRRLEPEIAAILFGEGDGGL